ncbi:uncharacterized protein LOC110819436 [Carica papaya]|uniref:uncharacterized protein LOC110819436 n=1 Tax=Carica papaya TaxID=3649 RepID=UPI000B8CF596|nr:uncharacterized protein LOC110819436 [Carica papaya]
MNISHVTEPPQPQPQPPPPSPPLTELVVSLEQATLMAKQLPTATDPTRLLHIYSSLHQAHLQLSSFLSSSSTTTPFPPLPLQSCAVGGNSLSSTTASNGSEPMQMGDDDEDNQVEADAEENSASKPMIDSVEERMRDCFIKNKRTKRRLSPSSAAVAEERRVFYDGFVRGAEVFDPYVRRSRALDLLQHFHG